jgi:tetratricopeptide (TPR) repeat protein
MRTTIWTVLLIASTARAEDATEPDDLPSPQAEVATREPKVDPPPVPTFELPAVERGFHRPRELRIHGVAVQDTAVIVKGYITSIYDCAAAVAPAHPGVSRAELLVEIDKDPRQCERPRFSLGDTPGTSREASIWVVDVPRHPAKPERDAMTKGELAAWPAVPRIAVGDPVIVAGVWATRSPHNERNTGGFLVYKSLEHAAPGAMTPRTTAMAPPRAPPGEPVAPQVAVASPPLRPYVDPAVRNASVDLLNVCTREVAARRYDAGIAACAAATRLWDGNHLAWYSAASAHIAKRDWAAAVTAVERAVALRPDQAMYQLYRGIAHYEAAQARAEPAHGDPAATGLPPRLGAARDALRVATRLAPELWRAHYYLGRVYRDLDDSQRAAEQFTQTIATHPTYWSGYIALIELYRRWDYVDQAIAVAKLGIANVLAGERAELWYEAGMAYDAKRADDLAIEAFGNAIAAAPADATSRFQRGQVYFRNGDFARARRDLDDVVKSADPQSAAVRPIAAQLLDLLDRKRRPPDGASTRACHGGDTGCTLDIRAAESP